MLSARSATVLCPLCPPKFPERCLAVLQDTTHNQQSFTYRVEWFDEKGMIINLPTYTAIPRSLEGKEAISITATAPDYVWHESYRPAE